MRRCAACSAVILSACLFPSVGDLTGGADGGLDAPVDVGPDVPAQVRHPITYSETPVRRYARPPRLGEHSEEIRRWLEEL